MMIVTLERMGQLVDFLFTERHELTERIDLLQRRKQALLDIRNCIGELAEIRKQRGTLLAACRRAEQTIRNLGNGFLTGDGRTIALNEAANLRADIAKAEGKQ